MLICLFEIIRIIQLKRKKTCIFTLFSFYVKNHLKSRSLNHLKKIECLINITIMIYHNFHVKKIIYNILPSQSKLTRCRQSRNKINCFAISFSFRTITRWKWAYCYFIYLKPLIWLVNSKVIMLIEKYTELNCKSFWKINEIFYNLSTGIKSLAEFQSYRHQYIVSKNLSLKIKSFFK